MCKFSTNDHDDYITRLNRLLESLKEYSVSKSRPEEKFIIDVRVDTKFVVDIILTALEGEPFSIAKAIEIEE